MNVNLRNIERVSVPQEIDVTERETWTRMEWRLGAKSATRLERDGSEQQTIAAPTSVIATWLLENWWSLLYELAPSDVEGSAPDWRSLDAVGGAWRHRHSVRTADSSLRLPDLRVFSNGPTVTWCLVPDANAQVGTRYLDQANVTTPRADAITSLGQVIRWTLDALRDTDTEIARWLRSRWTALQNSNQEAAEAEFCRAAGRLGLDPYDTGQWPIGVADWMASAPSGTLDSAFSVDLLGFGRDIDDLPSVDRALRALMARHHLEAHEVPAAVRDGLDGAANTPAFALGYQRAERLRRNARMDAESPLTDLALPLHNAAAVVFRSQTVNFNAPLSAIGGWHENSLRVLTPREPKGRHRSRFSIARGVYLTLWGGFNGPRLATDAKDRDQQAARAFAAELLAPRQALVRRVDALRHTMPIDDRYACVAADYHVAVDVVRRQVENARAGR